MANKKITTASSKKAISAPSKNQTKKSVVQLDNRKVDRVSKKIEKINKNFENLIKECEEALKTFTLAELK